MQKIYKLELVDSTSILDVHFHQSFHFKPQSAIRMANRIAKADKISFKKDGAILKFKRASYFPYLKESNTFNHTQSFKITKIFVHGYPKLKSK